MMRAFAFGATLDQLTRASSGVRSLDLASHLPQMKVKGDLEPEMSTEQLKLFVAYIRQLGKK